MSLRVEAAPCPAGVFVVFVVVVVGAVGVIVVIVVVAGIVVVVAVDLIVFCVFPVPELGLRHKDHLVVDFLFVIVVFHLSLYLSLSLRVVAACSCCCRCGDEILSRSSSAGALGEAWLPARRSLGTPVTQVGRGGGLAIGNSWFCWCWGHQ